jgi:KTSC domain-containing protein
VERLPVQSRALKSVGYDTEGRLLELEFCSGSLYRYFDVPEFTYRALMHAKSKGHFFQTSIDRRFRYEEVKKQS